MSGFDLNQFYFVVYGVIAPLLFSVIRPVSICRYTGVCYVSPYHPNKLTSFEAVIHVIEAFVCPIV